jgi:hypothetical protein
MATLLSVTRYFNAPAMKCQSSASDELNYLTSVGYGGND